jgi:hypothetical protein
MDFADELQALATRIARLRDHIQTEEATKTSFVLPFLSALGYNVFDPMEVTPELHADVGVKKGEKVDYAVLRDGQPIMLIECKDCRANLEDCHASQLYRYFSVTPARIGVVTNGIVYRFFSDLEEPNRMDAKPFLEIDMLNLREPAIQELRRFRKSWPRKVGHHLLRQRQGRREARDSRSPGPVQSVEATEVDGRGLRSPRRATGDPAGIGELRQYPLRAWTHPALRFGSQ